MPSAKTISKLNSGFPDYLDFANLREIGLEHIRNLSGDAWTDHNLHDPGITILEVLAYALLDLGYRTNHDIRDLLARDPSEQTSYTQFFSAAEILGNNPLTLNDFRKLLLDVRGVRNAWLELATEPETPLSLDCTVVDGNQLNTAGIGKKAFVNGLYNVYLELDPVRPQDLVDSCGAGTSTRRVLSEVKNLLHRYRNLCEDFLNICILQDEEIGFCAQLELYPDVDPEEALTNMFIRIRDWLSPEPAFYTLQDLLSKGKSVEEIYEGRPLTRDSHGFVDLEELDAARPNRHEIHVSDLYQVILSASAQGEASPIRAIRGLTLLNYIDGQAQTTGVDWCLHLTKGYRPVINPALCQIVCLKDGVPFTIDLASVNRRFTNQLTNASKIKRQPYELDLLIPEGQHRKLGDYYSIQRDLPAVYGIGEGGIPDSASKLRKAQALQLKGYLLFFDQLLANYLAQLSNVRQFFALQPNKNPAQTYFSGNIDNIPDVNQLLRGLEFQEKGEPITGETLRFRRGETVFFPEKTAASAGVDKPAYDAYYRFGSPQQRDDAINRLITAFEQDDYKIEIIEDDCKNNLIRLHTPVQLPGGGTLVLSGVNAYKDYDTVRTEAEALTFLALSREYFRQVDFQETGQYTFDITYEPRAYGDVLKSLAETPERALARRDRFLNHLLARFAEDFTEYALLRFTSGEQQSLASLIHDKEHFLANYPNISRNRSAGFDYSNSERQWDTDNITGLERRVGSLLGVEDQTRHTLAPFSVETTATGEKTKPSCLTIRDFRGSAIWEIPFPIQCEPTEIEGFISAFVKSASQKTSYQAIDCHTFGRYGFELLDSKSCTLGKHPNYYAAVAHRDRKCEYLSEVFAHPSGHFVRYRESEPGFFFYLEKDGVVLAKPPKPAENKAAALLAWVHFSVAAGKPSNFHITEDPYGRGYGLEIWADDHTTLLAYYPGFKELKAQAEALILTIQTCLSQNRPETDLIQAKSAWTWRFQGPDGSTWLQSEHRFGEKEQAGMAMIHALKQALEPAQLLLQETTEGWTYDLRKTDYDDDGNPIGTVLLAKHPGYFTTQAQAANTMAELMAAIAPETLFFRRILPKNHGFRTQWPDKTGAIMLQGTVIFPDEAAAMIGFEQLVQQVKDPKNVQVLHENGFHLRVLDVYGREIAIHPQVYFDASEAEEKALQLVQAALSKNHSVPNLEKTGKIWSFQLCGKEGEATMAGIDWFDKKEEAKLALATTLCVARDPLNLTLTGDAKAGAFQITLRDATGRALAESIASIASETEAKTTLLAWQTWFASDNIDFQIMATNGDWHFTIDMDQKLVLEGLLEYATETEAALALEMALALAASAENLYCEKEPGTCQYCYRLYAPDTNFPLAEHPHFFPNETSCDNAALQLAAYLAGLKSPYRLSETEEPAQWHIEVLWESCDDHIEQAFLSTEGRASLAGAETYFEDLREAVDALKLSEMPDKRWRIEIPGLPFVHPKTYDTQAAAECALSGLIQYLSVGAWYLVQAAPLKPFQFRLVKDNAEVATHQTRFVLKEERDTALEAERLERACRQASYSTLDLGYDRVKKVGNLYHFYLISNDLGQCMPGMPPGTILWKSVENWRSREEAEAAFDALYLDILALAENADHYLPDCNGMTACYYYLNDPKTGKMLVRTENFQPETLLETEARLRLCHARSYPIVKENPDCYGYRLNDPLQNRALWLSKYFYASPAEAMKAFERFLALLEFPENLYPEGIDTKPEFWFSLKETGLCSITKPALCNPDISCSKLMIDQLDKWFIAEKKEGKIVLQQVKYWEQNSKGFLKISQLGIFPGDCYDCPPLPTKKGEKIKYEQADAWAELESCLVSIGNSADFSIFLDESHRCRFGVQLTGTHYRLARFPVFFHDFAQREAERDRLFKTIRCEVLCPKDRFRNYVISKEDAPCYNRTDKWLCDYWNLNFGILAADDRDCCEPASKIAPAKVIDLMALARAADCYVLVQDAGGDKTHPSPMTWGLFDNQNSLKALMVTKTTDEATLEIWKTAAIAAAWDFPLVRKNNGFGFQLANGPEGILLESVHVYATPQEASNAFCRLLALLREKSNYAPSETSDCGPFSIDIVDPAEIKAKHPTTYPCRADAQAAAAALAECMDAEGFHLVEHLLLRPATPQSCLFTIECADCESVKGAEFWDEAQPHLGSLLQDDPYSFRATVVIPYWGRRFRNTNFRDFIERTLRREAPAHVLLRIAWVGPKAMRDFEQYWQKWLESNALGKTSCAWEEDLCHLINQMKDLRNTYAQSIYFVDNAERDSADVIVLDQTLLT